MKIERIETKAGAQIVVGAQYGDEGKGKVAAFLAFREQAVMVARAGVGPNAEHGIFLAENGPYLKVNQLPLGWVLTKDSQIRIGSGVAVSPNLFLEEIEKFELQERVKLDYRCPIITPEHIQKEKRSKKMENIGSTFSGSGYCHADHVLRVAKLARDIPQLNPFITDVAVEINEIAGTDVVVVESSQGTYLSLAISPDYPHVTSDNVTAMAAADDVGLNWRKLKEVVLVLKTMPTREGAGSLGSKELSPEEIKRKGLKEYSSIGGVIRRKGREINFEMLAYAVEINGATQIALTFCDHYDPRVRGVTNKNQITEEVWRLVERIQKETNVPVTILETGKLWHNIIDLTDKNIDLSKIRGEIKFPIQ